MRTFISLSTQSMKVTSILCLLVLAIVFGPVTELAHAQTQTSDTNTEFILEAGVNERSARFFEYKIETMLSAVNSWIISGEDTFPDEVGVDSLKRLVKQESLISKFDTLSSLILNYDGNFEIPGIFLQPRYGSEFDYTELIFTLSPVGELITVRKADNIQNIDRIINRDLPVNQEQTAQIQSFLDEYSRIFAEKNGADLRALFDEDALIVVGSRVRNSGEFRYTRYKTDAYLERQESNTLVRGNEIEVVFDSLTAYRHPQQQGVFGFQVYQYWNTTAYSDQGYMFFIADLSGDRPELLARFWQETPFKAGTYSQFLPDPKYLAAELTDIKSKFDGDTLSLAHYYDLNEGIMSIEFENGNPDLLDAHKLRDLINAGASDFSGISIDNSEILVSGDDQLSIPFSVDWKEGQQEVSTQFSVLGSENLNYYSREITLYLQRNNLITLSILENEGINEEPVSFKGDVLFSSNTPNLDVDVKTDAGQTLFSDIVSDTSFSYSLVEGEYEFEFSKEGFLPVNQNHMIRRSESISTSLILNPEQLPEPVVVEQPVTVVDPVPVENESFVKKNKFWIIGGAAVLVSAATYGLTRGGGDSGPGIPIPPGRPLN